MSQEVPLIRKILRGDGFEYVICSEGVQFLKSLKSKKLRIIFNITHQTRTLNIFNNWIINETSKVSEEQKPTACLTISKITKQISQDRLIVILTAYECFQQEPYMVLLGYLGSSVFIYHHFDKELSIKSPLTTLLANLWKLLSKTDTNKLNTQLSHSKGYAKNPYFLCLLSQKNKNKIQFDEIYHCIQGEEELNCAVDALIDYFPQRNDIILPLSKESVSAIGKQFQNSVLGRTVFNFEFTGSTLQNLCFECCQAFNNRMKINLSELYIKIIENQKTRLETESMQTFMSLVSNQFFYGGKFELNSQNVFPISPRELKSKCGKIAEQVLAISIRSATSCMTLTEYINVQKSLKTFFTNKFNELQQINNQKGQQFCQQCFNLMDKLIECDLDPQSFLSLSREIQNKMQLFNNQHQELIGDDPIYKLLWDSYYRLFQSQFGHLKNQTQLILDDLKFKEQEQRLQIGNLRYSLRVKENELRSLQFQYNVQGDILNQTKQKLLCQGGQVQHQVKFSLEANKLRRKLQEMEEEIKDKTLHIEELQSIVEKIDGARQKEKNKYKFSKEIQDLIKQVSQKVNSYFAIVTKAKQINQMQEQIRKRFNKEKSVISEQKNELKRQLAQRMSEIQRLMKQKHTLQQTVEDSKYSIEILRSKTVKDKESITLLQKNNTQLHCILAETENELQQYRKGLSLAGEQITKGGKSENLVKFCKVTKNSELCDLLRPFLKK